MNKQFTFSTFIFLLFFNGLEAQIKYEREYKIKRSEVPEMALDFVSEAGLSAKVKWYKEEGPDGDSFEAQAILKAKKYNVDFDANGQIEDVEVDIDGKTLDQALYGKINTYLKANYKKSKIRNVQIQYVGSRANLIQALVQTNNIERLDITTRYELIVNVKEQRSFRKFEFLFDEDGSLLRKTRVVVKNTDNLEY